jgi:hypothetical protein
VEGQSAPYESLEHEGELGEDPSSEKSVSDVVECDEGSLANLCSTDNSSTTTPIETPIETETKDFPHLSLDDASSTEASEHEHALNSSSSSDTGSPDSELSSNHFSVECSLQDKSDAKWSTSYEAKQETKKQVMDEALPTCARELWAARMGQYQAMQYQAAQYQAAAQWQWAQWQAMQMAQWQHTQCSYDLHASQAAYAAQQAQQAAVRATKVKQKSGVASAAKNHDWH